MTAALLFVAWSTLLAVILLLARTNTLKAALLITWMLMGLAALYPLTRL